MKIRRFGGTTDTESDGERPTMIFAGAVLRYFPDKQAPERGVWFGRHEKPHFYVRVAGDDSGPFQDCAATAEQIVENRGDVAAAIDRYVEALGPSGRIYFASRPDEAFPANICGFGVGHTIIDWIGVEDPAKPEEARLTIVTGDPDGYVSYRVTLERGVPTHIDAIFT